MKLNQRMIFSVLSSSLLAASSFCYALPFNIFPQTTLPTQIAAGQSLTALYTVQNNTGSFRGNNFVKYLPPNVGQVFSDPAFPNLCGPLFNLAPRGMPGDSCTLELRVSGPVNKNDPDPHHHLFVCFPGGKTCAGTLFPLDVKITRAAPLVTVGDSFFVNTNVLPLAYTSNNGGMDWILSPAFSLPAGRTQGILLSVDCVGSACTTVGESFVSNVIGEELPLAYTSNGGVNWTLSPPFVLPAGQTTGLLIGVSCAGNVCTTVGYSSDGLVALPLAYTSNNSGVNWSLSTAFPLPGGQTGGSLSSVDCISSTCTAVGASSGLAILPLAYTSSNSGGSWTLSSAFILPGGQTNGQLHSVKCIGNACTAVGDSFGVTQLPLAYTSSDGGANWALSSPIALPSGQTEGTLNGVTCVGTSCAAVGAALGLSTFPIAYTSNDGGVNWVLSSPLVLPAGQTQGQLTEITCTGNDCVAVGFSFSTNRLPLAYTSKDGGRNWVLSSPFVLPSGQTDGELNGVAGSGATSSLVKKFGLKNAATSVLLSKKTKL